MKVCIFCGSPVSDARSEIYKHCAAQTCVDTWMIQRRGAMSIALIPKVGFQPVFTKDMKGVSGRSSGR